MLKKPFLPLFDYVSTPSLDLSSLLDIFFDPNENLPDKFLLASFVSLVLESCDEHSESRLTLACKKLLKKGTLSKNEVELEDLLMGNESEFTKPSRQHTIFIDRYR